MEHERDFFEGRVGRGGGDDGVGHELLLVRDAALLDLDGEELLGRAVTRGVRTEELELRVDLLVLDERLRDEGGALVDALADRQGLVLTTTGRHARARLAGRHDFLLVVHALDRVLTTEAALRALALDVRAVRLEIEVYRLRHRRLPCDAVRPCDPSRRRPQKWSTAASEDPLTEAPEP